MTEIELGLDAELSLVHLRRGAKGHNSLSLFPSISEIVHFPCHHTKPAEYNPELLEILAGIKLNPESERIVAVEIRDMSVGMIVEQDIKALSGVLIAPKGQEVTWSLIKGLKNFPNRPA